MSFFKKFRKTKPTYGILVVGDSNVGKTWLQQCYRGLRGPSMIDKLSQKTYANMVVAAIEGIGANFEIITVVGSNTYMEADIPLFEEKISSCMAVIFCYDVSNRKSFESLGRWIDVVESKEEGMLRYLAACKCDRTHDVERGEAEKFARSYLLESFTETSAITNDGIDDLFENVMKGIIHWEQQVKRTNSKRYKSTLSKSTQDEVRDHGETSLPDVKVVVVGDSGIGKTTFLKRCILGVDAIEEEHEKFQGQKMTFRTGKKNRVSLLLWDTNGAECFLSITRAAYRGCSGIILLFDLSNRETFENLTLWVEELKTHCRATLMFLVGNKTDAERKVDMHDIAAFLETHKFDHYAEISSTSVSEQENILLLMAKSFEPFLEEGRIKAPGARGMHLLKDSEDIKKRSSWIRDLASSAAAAVVAGTRSVYNTVFHKTGSRDRSVMTYDIRCKSSKL